MCLHDAADGVGIRPEQQMTHLMCHDATEEGRQVHLRVGLEILDPLPEYIAVSPGSVRCQVSNPEDLVPGCQGGIWRNPQDETESIRLKENGTTGAVCRTTVEPVHVETSLFEYPCGSILGPGEDFTGNVSIVINRNSHLWIFGKTHCRAGEQSGTYENRQKNKVGF